MVVPHRCLGDSVEQCFLIDMNVLLLGVWPTMSIHKEMTSDGLLFIPEEITTKNQK